MSFLLVLSWVKYLWIIETNAGNFLCGIFSVLVASFVRFNWFINLSPLPLVPHASYTECHLQWRKISFSYKLQICSFNLLRFVWSLAIVGCWTGDTALAFSFGVDCRALSCREVGIPFLTGGGAVIILFTAHSGCSVWPHRPTHRHWRGLWPSRHFLMADFLCWAYFCCSQPYCFPPRP